MLGYGILICYWLVFVWDKETVGTQMTIWATHILGMLWTIQTIRATCWTSMAGAIAYWFVSLNAPNTQKAVCVRTGCTILGDALLTVLIKVPPLGARARTCLQIA